ncbi:KTSC domain-containing protein [Clavibacter michiganensis]|uniref:KTSC domain-containing protein n=1 Tax=Clavibacter michiganensis TaxID=28447 RepID=UPI001C64BFBF
MDWVDIPDSSWVAAIAYDATVETIYVRFNDNHLHMYLDCPEEIWAEFSSPETSKGGYIHSVLNQRSHGPA